MKPNRCQEFDRRKIRKILVPVIILYSFTMFSICFSQITGVSLESSSTLGPGRFQVGGIYGQTGISGTNGDGQQCSRYGFRAAIGVTDWLDLKFTYTRWDYTHTSNVGNTYQLSFKMKEEDKSFAFNIPIGYQRIKWGYDEGDSRSDFIYYITPQLLLNVLKTHCFEVDFCPYVEIAGGERKRPFYTTGLATGIGFSSNLDRWSIRLEGSIDLLTFFAGAPAYSFGTGLYINLGNRKEAIGH